MKERSDSPTQGDLPPASIQSDLLAKRLSDTTICVKGYQDSIRFWLKVWLVSLSLFFLFTLYGETLLGKGVVAGDGFFFFMLLVFGTSQIAAGIFIPILLLERDYAQEDYQGLWASAAVDGIIPPKLVPYLGLMDASKRKAPRIIAYPVCVLAGLGTSMLFTGILTWFLVSLTGGGFK